MKRYYLEYSRLTAWESDYFRPIIPIAKSALSIFMFWFSCSGNKSMKGRKKEKKKLICLFDDNNVGNTGAAVVGMIFFILIN